MGESWDYEVLEVLAQFEQLRELKLGIEDVKGNSDSGYKKDNMVWMLKLGIEGYLSKVKKGVGFDTLDISFSRRNVIPCF